MSDIHETMEQAGNAAAANPEAVDQAVTARMDNPAPPDEMGQFMERVRDFMTEVRQRLGQVEQVATAVAPLVEAGASMISGGVLDRVTSIEQFANNLFGALDKHWAGKLPIPTPPPVGGAPDAAEPAGS